MREARHQLAGREKEHDQYRKPGCEPERKSPVVRRDDARGGHQGQERKSEEDEACSAGQAPPRPRSPAPRNPPNARQHDERVRESEREGAVRIRDSVSGRNVDVPETAEADGEGDATQREPAEPPTCTPHVLPPLVASQAGNRGCNNAGRWLLADYGLTSQTAVRRETERQRQDRESERQAAPEDARDIWRSGAERVA